MVDYDAQIKELEDHLRKLQYNKATEHYFGVIRAKMAQLREKKEKRASTKGGGAGWFVKKSGDATVVLLGFPSVGKSTLLNKLTGAKSAVAAYEFTTLTVVPGVMKYGGAQIQILDVPGIIQGAASGRGRGREVLAMIRSADLVLILIDALHPEHLAALQNELYEANVRANQRPPDVRIVKKDKGGLNLATTKKLKVSKETMEAICREFRINNADIVIRSEIDADQFIDALAANRKYIPAITVVSKVDLVDTKKRAELERTLKPTVMVSANTDENIDKLREAVFGALDFIRIYLKEVNKKPDLEEPLILRRGVTLRSVCEHIHRDFVKKFRYARLWGPGAKFPGQVLSNLDKPMLDGDIVEIHTT